MFGRLYRLKLLRRSEDDDDESRRETSVELLIGNTNSLTKAVLVKGSCPPETITEHKF